MLDCLIERGKGQFCPIYLYFGPIGWFIYQELTFSSVSCSFIQTHGPFSPSFERGDVNNHVAASIQRKSKKAKGWTSVAFVVE